MQTSAQDWKLYFLTIVGWNLHPGHKLKREEIAQMLEDAAHLADEMQRITMEHKWPTGAQ